MKYFTFATGYWEVTKVRPENINNKTIKNNKYLRPIFLDRNDFSGGASLRKSTFEALRESQYLIVICSPNSAKSVNVNEEIIIYKSFGHSERIIPIIIAGEPYSETLECFPDALKYQTNVKGEISNIEEEPPLAPDARDSGDGEKRALAKVVAGMLGLPFDDIIRRADKERNNKNASILGGVIGAAIFSTLFSVYAIYQNNQSKLAINKSAFAISELIKSIDSVSEYNVEELRSDLLRSQCDLLENLTSLKNIKIGISQRTICSMNRAISSLKIDSNKIEEVSTILLSMLKKQRYDYNIAPEPSTDQIDSLLRVVHSYTSLQIEFDINKESALNNLMSITFELGHKHPDIYYIFHLHKNAFWLLIDELESKKNYTESIQLTFKTIVLFAKLNKEKFLGKEVSFEYGLLLRRYASLLNEHTLRYKDAVTSSKTAIYEFNKLSTLDPNNADINFEYMLANKVLGDTYMKLQEKSKATKFYQKALAISTNKLAIPADNPELLEKINIETNIITKILDQLKNVTHK